MGDDGGLFLIKERKDGGVILGINPPKRKENVIRAYHKRIAKRRAKKKMKR